ncbi:hypothetical protein FHL15_003237 [Xylaria flabelliformis]|uniref:Uncharacterized protein n=1 Tax=Xylaria flabelliformis TaxID=2512241 RepID=A0A553I648_9PEZI|nr:hypothetical protein FHL15_003237 [Xylaria flabelliformis]
MLIRFKPEYMYQNRQSMREYCIEATRSWIAQNGHESTAVLAVIVNGPHTSRSDYNTHLTVDLFAAGKWGPADKPYARVHVSGGSVPNVARDKSRY